MTTKSRKRSKRSQADKSARIDIRVTPAEKETLAKAAGKLGLSLSEYVLLSCSPDPENLQNILRKARPVDRADPQLMTALARTNLLLAGLHDQLSDSDASVTRQAILTTLLAVHRQLEDAKP